jgi:hypothetical protein
MRLRDRVTKLEVDVGQKNPLPYVVFQKEGESLEAAQCRALNGREAPPSWRFILAPEPQTIDQWIAKNSPISHSPIINP